MVFACLAYVILTIAVGIGVAYIVANLEDWVRSWKEIKKMTTDDDIEERR